MITVDNGAPEGAVTFGDGVGESYKWNMVDNSRKALLEEYIALMMLMNRAEE